MRSISRGPVLFLLSGLLAASTLIPLVAQTSRSSKRILQSAGSVAPDGGAQLRYRVIAKNARLNRRPMGAATAEVNGLMAEPVDSFTWNGVGSVPIDGELQLEINPIEKTGIIQASWTDENGTWQLLQTKFIHPEHFSGVRIGSSVNETEGILNEGIMQNVYLHGDTTAGMPILPTVFTHLSTWGPADVFRNGAYFPNPFEIPTPQWLAHLMVTEGVRNPDGTVRTVDGSIYNPSFASLGAVQPLDLEVHLVFHDERFPRTTSIPPLFSFFYHLTFEDVAIQIIGTEEPIPVGSLEVCPRADDSVPVSTSIRK